MLSGWDPPVPVFRKGSPKAWHTLGTAWRIAELASPAGDDDAAEFRYSRLTDPIAERGRHMIGKVVATFDNPVTAELAHNYLAENGLHPLLQNEEMLAVFSSMTNLVGGVKLLVPEDEEMVAKDLLVNRPRPESDPAAEAIVSAGTHVDADPDSLVESAADADCRRAWRTMVLGLTILLLPLPLASLSSGRGPLLWLTILALPLQLYSLYLLVRIAKRGERLSPRNRWLPLWTLLMFLPLWGVIGGGLVMFFNAADDPSAPHWRDATLDFSEDSAMSVEMPNRFATENFRNETPLGPMKHAADRAFVGDDLYWATVDIPFSSSPETQQDEAIETIVKAAAAKNGRTIESQKWIKLKRYTGLEYRMTFVDRGGRTWHGRAQMFRVGDRFLEIGLFGLGADFTDNVRAKRFFRSLKIP